jgi:high-affinity nickel-transport protein
MTTLLAVIALGFFLGMRHATDPDHVIAVTTIVARQRTLKHAAWIGVLWGIGHSVTILLVGAAIILFSVVIPPRIGLTMELSVGLMLVLLGVLNLTGIMRWITDTLSPGLGIRGSGFAEPSGEPVPSCSPPAGAFRPRPTGVCESRTPDPGTLFSGAQPGREGTVHSHVHVHRDYIHSHVHGHGPGGHGHSEEATPQGWLDRVFGRLGLYQFLRPLIVGVVHGMAGSAAVALLVLTVIRDPIWAISYLLVFGVGTIAGMMLTTAAIAVPFAYTGKRFARVNRYLAVGSGLVSLAFGCFIVYQIGFVQGLFTSHPHWTPR